MRRSFKIIVIVLLFVIAGALAGLFIFLKTFDVNRFKPQIIAAAEKGGGEAAGDVPDRGKT